MRDFYVILEDFLTQMTAQQEPDNNRTIAFVPELCRSLRIGRMELHLRENIVNMRMQSHKSTADAPYSEYILFDAPDYDIETQITEQFRNSGGGACLYLVFPHKGAEPWTEIETARIRLIVRLIYNFNAKNSLLNMISRLAFYDQELNVHNLT